MRDLRGLGSCMIGLVCSSHCLDLKSELSEDRRYLQAAKDLEIAIRDWATETGSVVCRHVTGTFRLFFVHRLILTHSSVNTFHRQHSRTPIHPNQTYHPTTDRLHRQMGPPSRISGRNTCSTASGSRSRTTRSSRSSRKSRKCGRRLIRQIPRNHLG